MRSLGPSEVDDVLYAGLTGERRDFVHCLRQRCEVHPIDALERSWHRLEPAEIRRIQGC